MEEALEGLNPTQIVAIRLALGGIALLLLVRATRTALPGKGSTWVKLAGMGLLGQAIPWLLFASGQEEVTSALAGLYTGLTPLLTIPVAWLFLRERPSTAAICACLVGFAGLAVVLAPWSGGGDVSLRGQLLCLGGAACYAVAYSYAGRMMKTVDDTKLSLAASQALTATVIMVPVSSGQLVEPATATWLIVVCLALLGLGTAVAFVVNYWLIARVGPVSASLAFYLIPIVAVVAGMVVRGERLHPNEVVGSVLILAALAALYLWERARDKRTPVAAEAH
ncbi:drug/metabolite transporter (DMT)-like permease [Saccharothrix tamanrassetensis]|uniref:Drug/metabolite transporter (DMT)-like permease n=1 Tax=Saccharothrix tamanrassetensis TaxID=1051531 RepID=A0A841CQB4_9PSEU|nr:DMT family transporter [Saccharothrix tamanrassetensis]MBB5958185.1 drug/metabolite transporter (DMT)-like permease [Saccharothrix tamanrassetensis]